MQKIKFKDLLKFSNDLLCKYGVDSKEASIVSKNLIWNDMIGRYNQGIWRLPVYIERFRRGLIHSPCHSRFVKKSEAVYLLRGKSGFGQYLGHKAMTKTIKIARQKGIGLVGVCNSNHYGSGAYYVELAAQSHQLGFAFSNSLPHVAPYGGISKVLGTNPFAFAAPVRNGKSIIVDFSTGSCSGSAIMKALENKENISKGIVVDEEGNDIVDPKKALKGIVLPFGGAKGFAIGLMVEILSGVITGAGISHEVASLHKCFDRTSNVGHLFMALDISKIMALDSYYSRIEQLIFIIKQSRIMKGFDEILIPGERRWRCFEKQMKEGISLDKQTVNALNKLARELQVSPPWEM